MMMINLLIQFSFVNCKHCYELISVSSSPFLACWSRRELTWFKFGDDADIFINTNIVIIIIVAKS